jgi:hypothetical protein
MRAPSAAESSGARRLIVSESGQLAATVEGGRIAVFDGQRHAAVSEIGIDGDAESNDVVFVGARPRLVVLERSAARAVLHVIDPIGPAKLGELVLHAGAQIAAVGGDQIFVIASVSGIVDASRTDLQFVQLSVRTAVTAASALAPELFLVASGGALEEWTTAHNAPKPVRRLRFASPIEAQRIGGHARRVWVVPRRDPDRVDILSLGSRSTRTVELPEPAARIAAHPAGHALIAVGARTRTAYVVNLARTAAPERIDRGPVHDAVWSAGGQAILIWPVDGVPEVVAAPSDLADLGGERGRSPDERARPLDERARPAAPATPAAWTASSAPSAPAAAVAEASARSSDETAADATPGEPLSRGELLGAWRQRLRGAAGSDPGIRLGSDPAIPLGLDPGSEAVPVLAITDAIPELTEHRGGEGWRGALATWTRAVLARSRRPFPVLDPSILDAVVTRLGLAPQRAAVGLLYGAHLLGSHGIAAYDAASALDWQWGDVLAGALLASGTAVWRADRLHLAAELVATLDERPPIAGVLVGDGASTEPIRAAVIAPPELPDDAAAEWAASVIGRRLLATGPRGEHRPARFSLEARARGVTPFLRVGATAPPVLPSTCVVAVPDAAFADRLALDVHATWPHGRVHEIGS